MCYHKSREYGVTEHKGKHRLMGPGLDPSTGKGGVSHMGGRWTGSITSPRWPIRLANTCLEMMGEMEDSEEQVYLWWREVEDGGGWWRGTRGMVGPLCRNEDRWGSFNKAFPCVVFS